MTIETTNIGTNADEKTLTKSGNTMAIKNSTGGSGGEILFLDVSGNANKTASGSSGFVLQSNGTDTPTWVANTAPTLLSTSTVSGSDSASVTFSSFTNYDYYVIESYMATDASGADVHPHMRFNADTTAGNYQYAGITSSNASVAHASSSSDGDGVRIGMSRDGASATFGMMKTLINNTSASRRKTFTSLGGNGTAYATYHGSWINTSNLITAIELRIDGTKKFKVGSIFKLYGTNAPN